MFYSCFAISVLVLNLWLLLFHKICLGPIPVFRESQFYNHNIAMRELPINVFRRL